MQFFGSTVERFTEVDKLKQNEELGPGSYTQDLTSFGQHMLL